MERKVLMNLIALALLISGFLLFLIGRKFASSILILIGVALYFIDKRLNPQLS